MSSCMADRIEALEAFGSWASVVEVVAYTGRPIKQVRNALCLLPLQVEHRNNGRGRPRSVYRLP